MNVLAETASVRLDPDPATRRGRVVFSLTNRGNEPAVVVPTPIALDQELVGSLAATVASVNLDAGTTGICLVAVAVPMSVAAGNYRFRLDLVPAGGGPPSNGPEITVTVAPVNKPPPAQTSFPWWLVVLGLVLLATAITLLWIALDKPKEPIKTNDQPPAAAVKPAEAAEVKPAPAAEVKPAPAADVKPTPTKDPAPKTEPAHRIEATPKPESRPSRAPTLDQPPVRTTPAKPVEPVPAPAPSTKPKQARQFNQ